ncbi:hypothetical protein ACH9D2_11340 [Kocuria sp. M4R2S49]|uniref:hypothetical protein n=1 Tax=Kocuria rhizosphaericola TaxID=3376284 RepID=UPI0037B2BD88
MTIVVTTPTGHVGSRGQRGFTPENPRELSTTTPIPPGAWAHAVLRSALAA